MDQAVATHEESRKSHLAFRTISEVAQEIDVPQHVLRFWESRFSQIKPLKRGGGRRYYRPEDIQLLLCIKNYLYKQGYTIKGVQRILKESRRVLDTSAGFETYRRASDLAEAAQQVPPADFAEVFEESFSGATEAFENPPPVEGDALARSLEAVTTIHDEIENPTEPMRVEAEAAVYDAPAEEAVVETVAEAVPQPTAVVMAMPAPPQEDPAQKAALREILGELVELRDMLRAA